MKLTQENLTVLQYKVNFMELSCFAPHIVFDEECKAMKFQRGLKPYIKLKMSALRTNTLADKTETTRLVERKCDELQHI